MAVSTYGFDGSSGATDKDAGGVKSDPSKSSDGSAADYLWKTIDGRDRDYTDNIAGMSPVSGLNKGADGCNSDWEATSVLGDEISYVGNNAPVPNPGQTGNTLGPAWPITYNPFPKGTVDAKQLPDRASDRSWDKSAKPGTYESMNSGNG